MNQQLFIIYIQIGIYKNKVLLSIIGLFYKMKKDIVNLIIQYIITSITSSNFYFIHI